MADFAGKSVVVTGGAQGIGLQIVREFHLAGARVSALDQDSEALNELPKGVRPVQVDVSDAEEVERAVTRLPERVDVLVNNAGVGGEWRGILETTVDEWDRVLNTNLRAQWLMAKFIVPRMPADSAIVNIASTRALMSEPNTEPYSASKGGVLALTHSLAISLAERRIRVNSISPGWIETSRHQKNSRKSEPKLRPEDHSQHPVGRVGIPEDIAAACLYLASSQAGFITGTNLIIDGGMTTKMLYNE